MASSAPSDGNWATETHWYKISLGEKYLSAYTADANGNVRATATEAPTGAGAYWCVVADGENGYKLYNRAAGPNRVLGLSQATTSDGYDATRANFYAATTASSTTEVGTSFDISLMENQTAIYKSKLKDGQNLYWNVRDGFLGYWKNGSAATDNGSKVRFYAVDATTVEADDNVNTETYKNTLSEKITAANSFISDDKVGYYSQSAVNAAQAVLNNNSSKAGDYYFAALELQPNMPKAGVLYCIKSANTYFTEPRTIYHEGTTTKWGKNDATNAAQYWFFTPWGGGYKLQAVDTKTYFNTSRNMSTDAGFVEIAWYAPNVANIRVHNESTLHAEGHKSGSGVSGNVIGYQETGFGKEGGPSSWTIVEATLEDAKQMQVKGTPEKYEGGLLVGGFDAQNAEAFHQDMASSTTMKEVLNKINSKLPVAGHAIDVNKYYRLVCVSPKTGNKDADNKASDPTYTTLTRGTNNVVTAPFSKGNVDQIWKFEQTEGGYYLKNMNGNGYLNNVRAGDTRAKLVETPSDKFEIKEGSISTQKALHVVGLPDKECLFAENHPNEPTKGDPYAVGGWHAPGADYSNGAWAWKLVEADDIKVALNNNGDKSYASVYLPFGVSEVSGAEAYVGTLDTDNSVLNMTQATSVPTGKGFVLVGAADATEATLSIGNVTETVNSDLTGTNTAITLTDATRANYLVFGKNKDAATEVGFFKPSTSVPSIPANKAYLDATRLAGGSAIAMNFGGNTTGVNTVVLGENGVNAPVFDLSGRRVVAPVKGGVYIQNGKKFIK